MDSARRLWVCFSYLSLRLAARCLLDLGLVFAAGTGAGTLGWSGFAGGALDLLALDFVGDGGGVCHLLGSSLSNLNVSPAPPMTMKPS